MTAKDKGVEGPPRQVINDFRVEDAVVDLANTVEVLVAMPHYLARSPATSPAQYPSAWALPMASAELSRRVGKVVGYPPLSEMSADQRREFHEALLEADSFEDLPGKWQAAILNAAENRPKLRVVSGT